RAPAATATGWRAPASRPCGPTPRDRPSRSPTTSVARPARTPPGPRPAPRPARPRRRTGRRAGVRACRGRTRRNSRPTSPAPYDPRAAHRVASTPSSLCVWVRPRSRIFLRRPRLGGALPGYGRYRSGYERTDGDGYDDHASDTARAGRPFPRRHGGMYWEPHDIAHRYTHDAAGPRMSGRIVDQHGRYRERAGGRDDHVQ